MADNVAQQIGNISLKSEKNEEKKENLNSNVDNSQVITKIDVLLKATGDAPIIKQKKWQVEPDKSIGWIISFIKRKVLKMDASESLFLYVNQSFAPSPDQIIRNLYECFGSDGKLVLHYCKTQAWG